MRQYDRCQRPGGGENPPRSTACLVSRGSPWPVVQAFRLGPTGNGCQLNVHKVEPMDGNLEARRPSCSVLAIHCHAQCHRVVVKKDLPSVGGTRAAEDRRSIPVDGMHRATDRLGRRSYPVGLNGLPRRRGTKSRFPLAVPRTPPFAPFHTNVLVSGNLPGETFDENNLSTQNPRRLRPSIPGFLCGSRPSAFVPDAPPWPTPMPWPPLPGTTASLTATGPATALARSLGRSPMAFGVSAPAVATNSPRPSAPRCTDRHPSRFRSHPSSVHNLGADCYAPQPLRGRHSIFGRSDLKLIRYCEFTFPLA